MYKFEKTENYYNDMINYEKLNSWKWLLLGRKVGKLVLSPFVHKSLSDSF